LACGRRPARSASRGPRSRGAQRDAIVWFPGNFGWSPANVGRERAAGAELRAVIAPRPTSLGLVSARGWGGVYSAQLDVARTVGPRLVIPTPYVARASGGATPSCDAAPASSPDRAGARPRPFASAPASRAYELPAVALVGLRAGATFGGRSGRLLVTVGADNVGAAEWQSVRGYPTSRARLVARGHARPLTVSPRRNPRCPSRLHPRPAAAAAAAILVLAACGDSPTGVGAAVPRGVVVLNGFGQQGVTLVADTGTSTARIDFGASFDGGGMTLERDTVLSTSSRGGGDQLYVADLRAGSLRRVQLRPQQPGRRRVPRCDRYRRRAARQRRRRARHLRRRHARRRTPAQRRPLPQPPGGAGRRPVGARREPQL
jgi:hypothetical protein